MSKKKLVIFDLDGTLLPMKHENFVKAYFGSLAKKLAVVGYDPEKLIAAVWEGTKTMIQNDGSKTNEEAFWCKFVEAYGNSGKEDIKYFAEYYETDFDKVQEVCGFNPKVKELIDDLKKNGYRIVLATNPIFPKVATDKRIGWAGLKPSDFELYTTYESSRFCKPNPEYFLELCKILRVSPEECLMIGNDVVDDMAAQKLGMNVFLLTDSLLNGEGKDLSCYPHGNFEDLIKFIKNQQKIQKKSQKSVKIW